MSLTASLIEIEAGRSLGERAFDTVTPDQTDVLNLGHDSYVGRFAQSNLQCGWRIHHDAHTEANRAQVLLIHFRLFAELIEEQHRWRAWRLHHGM